VNFEKIARFDVPTAQSVQIMGLWCVTLCTVVDWQYCFGETGCLCLRILKMEAVGFSEALVPELLNYMSHLRRLWLWEIQLNIT
jgi:hypothetical protein